MPMKIFPNFSALEKAVDGGMIFENGETIKVGKYAFDVQVHTNAPEREVKHIVVDPRLMRELL